MASSQQDLVNDLKKSYPEAGEEIVSDVARRFNYSKPDIERGLQQMGFSSTRSVIPSPYAPAEPEVEEDKVHTLQQVVPAASRQNIIRALSQSSNLQEAAEKLLTDTPGSPSPSPAARPAPQPPAPAAAPSHADPVPEITIEHVSRDERYARAKENKRKDEIFKASMHKFAKDIIPGSDSMNDGELMDAIIKKTEEEDKKERAHKTKEYEKKAMRLHETFSAVPVGTIANMLELFDGNEQETALNLLRDDFVEEQGDAEPVDEKQWLKTIRRDTNTMSKQMLNQAHLSLPRIDENDRLDDSTPVIFGAPRLTKMEAKSPADGSLTPPQPPAQEPPAPSNPPPPPAGKGAPPPPPGGAP
eukprot:Sspe_Gene.39252::Locus_18937_Transcript_1_1_Confidence_1.000_Length_1124::g.39252::m.39252